MKLATGIVTVLLGVIAAMLIERAARPKYVIVPEWVYNSKVAPAPRHRLSINLQELRRHGR